MSVYAQTEKMHLWCVCQAQAMLSGVITYLNKERDCIQILICLFYFFRQRYQDVVYIKTEVVVSLKLFISIAVSNHGISRTAQREVHLMVNSILLKFMSLSILPLLKYQN